MPPPPRHSIRNVRIGSVRSAATLGPALATAPTTSKITPAATRLIGSKGFIWKRNPAISLVTQ